MIYVSQPAMPTHFKTPSDLRGLTVQQLVLKDFMCAIVAGIHSDLTSYEAFIAGAQGANFKGTLAEYVVENAAQLTDAYMAKLNKDNNL